MWICFGDAVSNGKTNDHMFHDAGMTSTIKHYDNIRLSMKKQRILINITWRDNCPIQYKCTHIFLNATASISNHPSSPSVVQNFAQNFRFKSSWDVIIGKMLPILSF